MMMNITFPVQFSLSAEPRVRFPKGKCVGNITLKCIKGWRQSGTPGSGTYSNLVDFISYCTLCYQFSIALKLEGTSDVDDGSF
jgi:hypothetical protein